MAGVLFVSGAEPVREGPVQVISSLAEAAFQQGRPAFARFVRYHERETVVLRGCPKRRFPQARVPHQSDVARINRFVRNQVIHRAAQAPRPRPQRAPVFRLLRQHWAHAMHHAPHEIRLHVVVINGGQTIAAGHQFLHLPVGRVAAARAVVRRDVEHVGGFIQHSGVFNPHVRSEDSWVRVDRVVAIEIEAQKDRARLPGGGGQVEQQMHLRPRVIRRKVDGHLLADGLAIQGFAVREHFRKAQRNRPRRRVSVHLIRKERHQFRAALFVPALSV